MDEQLRGLFFTGNFAKAAQVSKSATPESLLLQLRAAVESKQTAFPGVPSSPGFPAAAFNAFAEYLRGRGRPEQVEAVTDGGSFAELAKVYVQINEGNFSQLMDSLVPNTPEKQALLILVLLKLNRADVADQLLKKALSAADEDPVIQVAQTWVALSQSQPEEASSTLSELESKFGASAAILTARGAGLLQEGNYAEAEQVLAKAVAKALSDLSDTNAVATAMVNYITCKRMLGESAAEAEAQLASACPDHPYFRMKATAEEMFAQAIA